MSSKSRWLSLAILSAVYFAIACLITWPLFRKLGTHLVGRTSDAMVHYWNGWWVQQALSLGQSPFQTSYLSFPEGVSLVTHNFAWLNILPWLLLEPLIGGVWAYNLIVLFSLTLCGLAVYLLADELLHNGQAAFIAGLIYMAWPYRQSQLDHPNLIATFCIPLFFLFLIRTLRGLRWRDAIFAAIALALVGYTRWQLLLPAVFMAIIYVAGTAKQWLRQWKALLPRLGLLAILAIFALLPPAVMLIREQAASSFSANIFLRHDEQIMSTDLLAYVTPGKRHFILGELTKPLYDRYYPDRSSGRRYPAYVGLSVLLLAFIGIVRRWREAWIWLLMAVLLAGLASSMILRVNGQLLENVPTLYRLLAPLQIARLIRVPERYVLFMALPISMLAAYGWFSLVATKRLARWSIALTLLLAMIILFEYLSLPTRAQYVDYDKTILRQLAREPGSFAVLNVPIRYRFSKEYMFEQTYHERPILQGHVSREPENLYRFINDNSWFSGLPDLATDPGFVMAQLNNAKVAYVLLSKHWLEEPTWQLWKQHVPYAPYFEDDRFLVYATTPQFGRDLQPPAEILPGLGTVEKNLSAFCSEEQIVAVADLTWANTESLPEDYEVSLVARSVKTGQQSESPLTPLAGTWPASQWPANSITRHAYSIALPPDEAPYSLSLQLFQSGVAEPHAASIDLGQIDDTSCSIAAGSAPTANLPFGDKLRLLAYDVQQEEGNLALTLYWLAEERPAAAYKFFVHVYDPQTDAIVAQIDTMPQEWRLPTTIWSSGELVADEINLSLADVPPGDYKVAIGVYDAETGQRLPVGAADHQLTVTADGRLHLPHTVKILER
ncbi:MAG: hypothetical protein GWP61_09650 [Chloroflexi bacterium]|jgi:hypothetical protein|nr:hypothetical protein [Chloroflexota bacterium]